QAGAWFFPCSHTSTPVYARHRPAALTRRQTPWTTPLCCPSLRTCLSHWIVSAQQRVWKMLLQAQLSVLPSVRTSAQLCKIHHSRDSWHVVSSLPMLTIRSCTRSS